MTADKRQPTVIIGIGNSLRGDDAIGPLVVEACGHDTLADCELVELEGETTRVIDAWRDRELAIVVDAVCAGDEPGTVHDLTMADMSGLGSSTNANSSHAAGIAEAVALGRSLGRMPSSLRVLGIEPGDLNHGVGLSPQVAASMDELIRRVRNAALATRATRASETQ